MINFLRRLFSTRREENVSSKKLFLENEVLDNKFEWYIKREIENCKFIKKECQGLILDHFLKKKDILRTHNKLSVDEKKMLGINTKLSITRELIEVLNEDGIKSNYPKAIISNLYNRALHAKSRRELLNKLRKSSFDKVVLKSSGGGSGDCDWCVENQNIEYSVHKEIEILIEENCSCDPYCYCYISPISKDFE